MTVRKSNDIASLSGIAPQCRLKPFVAKGAARNDRQRYNGTASTGNAANAAKIRTRVEKRFVARVISAPGREECRMERVTTKRHAVLRRRGALAPAWRGVAITTVIESRVRTSPWRRGPIACQRRSNGRRTALPTTAGKNRRTTYTSDEGGISSVGERGDGIADVQPDQWQF